ncbi:hypothetical protein D0Z07_0346 [Hyphodiscus hymeniophilus]|uniref:ER transporter 6TM N-terminal domain-containing protein n=1 Tax=Hyphodiscus hymeniophilus TaxID=353542 RepID=A0A9P7B114_9HELO|nr:hypothetical protein D0Z07_0346 [Hyphodiscus hymeniophilus]
MSILTVPVLPRARFIQNFLVTCLLVCLAAAISLLAMWISTKARANTTHIPKPSTAQGAPVPGAEVSPYNAAASVNMAFWLFFEVWIINTFRAYRPQYFLPSIVCSIFIQITSTYGVLFATMEQVESLITRVLESFFAGFAISAAVSLFIIPITSRTLIYMLMTGEIHALKKILEVHSQYMRSLPTRDWYGEKSSSKESDSGMESDGKNSSRTTPWPEADTLKSVTSGVAEVQVKIQAELRYAKLEAAWGKLRGKDISTITRLLKGILVPILGMESLTDVTDRIEKRGGWGVLRLPKTDHGLTEAEFVALEEKEKQEWNWIFDKLQRPVHKLQQAMIEGLDHCLYTLEFAKRPKDHANIDIEASPSGSYFVGKAFAPFLESKIQEFLSNRENFLKEWCAFKCLDYPKRDGVEPSEYPLHERHQSQLYLVLDLEYSFIMTARGVLDFVKYADSKIADGTMAKNRFIYPTWRQLKQWFWDALSREDGNLDYQAYSTRSGSPIVRLTDAIPIEKDPEHLPPVTAWEKFTDHFRIIPRFFGSAESTFGFRVATGTMCIAIVCYLRNSQEFFIQQRIIWGSIMASVAISMTQTAGSGIYGQAVRFGGTCIAMVASYIIWYLPDQHTAGIIVFTGIAMFFYHYPFIKNPADPVIPMIGMVTVVLIVGYELQVKQIGVEISISNGQVYHPLYELAPYRLAAVSGGVAIAFLFTYFPSVDTARAKLRNDLGAAVYLMSNYYSSVHQTVSLRIRGAEGDMGDKTSTGRVLQKARTQIFVKELILLQGMKQHCKFLAWEPTFGGKFPRATYDKLLDHTQNILHFSTMISYVTETFKEFPTEVDTQITSESWMKDFKELIASLQLTSQNVTSLLSIVAAAISTGRPLPPYLKAPKPVRLSQLLESMDADILSPRHVLEAGYAAFAVMQVATSMLGDDLEGLLEETKNLVGEVKFGIEAPRVDGVSSAHLMIGEKQD